MTRAKRLNAGLLHLELERRLDRRFLLGIRIDMADQRVSGFQLDTLISIFYQIFSTSYTYNGDMVGIDQRMVLAGPQFAYERALGADRRWMDTNLRFYGALQYMALREHYYITPDRSLSFNYDLFTSAFGVDPFKPGEGPDYTLPLNRVASHTRHGLALQLGMRGILYLGQRLSVTVFDISGLLATPVEMPTTTTAAANGREARTEAHQVAPSRLFIACGLALHL